MYTPRCSLYNSREDKSVELTQVSAVAPSVFVPVPLIQLCYSLLTSWRQAFPLHTTFEHPPSRLLPLQDVLVEDDL